MAINNAQKAVRENGDLPVPLHLRNAPTKLMVQKNTYIENGYISKPALPGIRPRA